MEQIQQVLLIAIPLLFAITIHEVSHGFVALQFGDKTAKMMGRLTLNPIKHIDPVGTILVPFTLFMLSGFVFGWAKPVPVNPRNFSHLRLGTAVVAAAGPLSNLLMAFFWGAIMLFGIYNQQTHIGLALAYMGKQGIFINIILMVLNFIPIPPLDGSRVVSSLLPGRMAYYYEQVEPYGFIILLILIITGLLSKILIPPVLLISQWVMGFYI